MDGPGIDEINEHKVQEEKRKLNQERQRKFVLRLAEEQSLGWANWNQVPFAGIPNQKEDSSTSTVFQHVKTSGRPNPNSL